MSDSTAGDPRLEAVVRELRAGVPVVPPVLRERVLALAAHEPAARRSRWPSIPLRRGLLYLAPACLAVALGAAAVQGVISASRSDGPRPLTSQALEAQAVRTIPSPGAAEDSAASGAPEASLQGRAAPGANRALKATPLPPSGTRPQAYDAVLSLRVRDLEALSQATGRAMRLARSLGGYVAAVDYATRAEGTATLRLRIPVSKVQGAMTSLSELGTILAQRYSVEDLGQQFRTERSRLSVLRGRIAGIQARLRDPALTAEARLGLQRQLAVVRGSLERAQRAHRGTQKRARLAKVTLTLTTRDSAVPAKTDRPGRIERALDDAGSVLAREVAWAIYLVVVLAPLILLAGLLVAGVRLARRRSDRLLLERF